MRFLRSERRISRLRQSDAVAIRLQVAELSAAVVVVRPSASASDDDLMEGAVPLSNVLSAGFTRLELDETRQRLALLGQLSSIFVEADDRYRAIRKALQVVGETFTRVSVAYYEWDSSGVRRIGGAGKVSRLTGRLGLSDRPSDAYFQLVGDEAFFAVSDVGREPRLAPVAQAAADLEIAALMHVATSISVETHGGVLFATSEPHHWTASETVTFTEIADLVLVAAKSAHAEQRRARLEADLRAQNELLAEVLDVAATAIIALQGEHVIIFNRAAEALTGYAASEVEGLHYVELPFVPKDDVARIGTLLDLPPEKTPRTYEQEWLTRGGEVRRLVWKLASWSNRDEQKILVASGIDYTEYDALRGELEQTRRIASLGRLAANVAHEFNNVLMSVVPFAEVIRRVGSKEKKIDNAITHINRAVERGRRITQDLLRFTRPGEPVREEFDAVSWLRDFAAEARATLPEKISLEVQLPEDPVVISADADHLAQVFSNLVGNAGQALPDGGNVMLSLTLNGRPTPPSFTGVSVAHFSVEDSGPGIPPQLHQVIFEPLFTTKKSGTGLGLSIARQVIAAQGGTMWVESEAGEGSRFHVIVPTVEQKRRAG